MMKQGCFIGIACLLMFIAIPSFAAGPKPPEQIARRTVLTGFQEVPALLTQGVAILKTKLDHSETSLTYTLTFSGLSSNATVAHIHFGQTGVNGAVMAFLCGGGSKPACPATGGEISGVIIASDIMAVPAQGINAGNFADFVAVMRSGNAYANLHTTSHPSGEIRGQLRG